MKILHEWHFHNRVCRVVESDPGIVHFEEATRTTGDPSIMLFSHTPTPMGAANEIIQLSMALAEANVINRDLSAAIQRWQEDRTAREQEIERLRAKLDEAKSAIRWMHGYDEPGTEDFPFCPEGKRFAWRSVARQQFAIVREACAEPIPLPEPKEGEGGR